MKTKSRRKLTALFFAICMALSFVPIPAFATEALSNIKEVNIKGVSNKLLSDEDVPFATVDKNSEYTIKSQQWISESEVKITPSSANLKPVAEESYLFVIELEAKSGYIFPRKLPESPMFYNGDFKVDGDICNEVSVTVTSDKTITAILFPNTKALETQLNIIDINNPCEVTEKIELKKGSDYVIDFTKTDSLSRALSSMADLEKTKYYKFANSDNNSLVEIEDPSEALIKIVGNKSENKAIMTLVKDIDTDIFYTLKFMRSQFTGSETKTVGTFVDEQTGKEFVRKIKYNYITRYIFNCELRLIANTQKNNSIELVEINNATINFNSGDKPVFTGKVPEDANYACQCEWWETDNGKTGVNSQELGDQTYENHITSFENGKTYRYGLYLKANDGYCFTSDTKLKINGEFVNYKRYEGDDSDGSNGIMWVITDLTMTPQATNEATEYEVIEGANGTWMQNSDKELRFRINGDISKFVGVKVDDEWLDKENYVADAGSTIVTLKNEYLKNLSVGKHKITFVYTDGEASTNFEVRESEKIYENSDISEPNIPKTGDNISVNFWIMNALGMLMLVLLNRKKKYTI